MSSLSRRSLGRRQIAVMAAALTVFGGFMAFRTQAAAQAHPQEVSLGMTCNILTLTIPVDVAYTVEHTPDTAVAGEEFTITTDTTVSMPADAPAVPLTSIAITIPVPFGVVGGGDIMVMGGNVTKAGQTSGAGGTVLTLNANAGVTTATLDMPQLMIPVTIAEEVPETIVFEGPSSLELVTSLGAVSCTANAHTDRG